MASRASISSDRQSSRARIAVRQQEATCCIGTLAASPRRYPLPRGLPPHPCPTGVPLKSGVGLRGWDSTSVQTFGAESAPQLRCSDAKKVTSQRSRRLRPVPEDNPAPCSEFLHAIAELGRFANKACSDFSVLSVELTTGRFDAPPFSLPRHDAVAFARRFFQKSPASNF
jgi:hypothetical protein